MGKEQLLKAAEGTKESAEGHYRAATAQLSYSEIRSPIDGVVTDRPLYVGDLADRESADPDGDGCVGTRREGAHSASRRGTVESRRRGAKSKSKAEESVAARVSLVSPALDPGSTTVEVWVETRKPSPYIKPGMTVDYRNDRKDRQGRHRRAIERDFQKCRRRFLRARRRDGQESAPESRSARCQKF